LKYRGEFTKPEASAGCIDSPLNEDKFPKGDAGQQRNVGEIKDQADWCPIAGQVDGDLFGNLANGPLVKELMVGESDDHDAVNFGDLNPGGNSHGSNPGKVSEVGLAGRVRRIGHWGSGSAFFRRWSGLGEAPWARPGRAGLAGAAGAASPLAGALTGP